jgi:hypothetical protein
MVHMCDDGSCDPIKALFKIDEILHKWCADDDYEQDSTYLSQIEDIVRQII